MSGARAFYPRAHGFETPFAAADADLGDRDQRNLPGRCGKTKLVRLDASRIAIRFHASDVVIYHASGAVEVSTGGRRGHDDGQGSVTTKARIQEYAPGFRQLWQHKKRWLVRIEGYPTAQRFEDGMTLYPDGVLAYRDEAHVQAVARFVNPPPPPQALRRVRPVVVSLALDFHRSASALALAR